MGCVNFIPHQFQLSRFHTEFQLSQTLSIPIFLSFYTFMANPSGATVQSSMGENLEIAKILETTRCPKAWVHFDLCLMKNGSKKARCRHCQKFFEHDSNSTLNKHLDSHASLFIRVRIRLKRILPRKVIFSFIITKHYKNNLHNWWSEKRCRSTTLTMKISRR